MKKYTTLILLGMILILAALLAGTLIFVKNYPPEQRAVMPQLVTIPPYEPDSSVWGQNYPLQYSSFLKTADNKKATKYGGSEPFSHLERDPRQVILFAGNPFSWDYNEDRGHAYALTDVNATKRVTQATHATCYSCKTANSPAKWNELGLEGYDALLFSEMSPHMTETIGCANCHEAGTMRLIVTNPSLENALKEQGLDWRTFSRQQMRSLVCANCHVEYYMVGEKKILVFPWDHGKRVDQILNYYDEIGFSDWKYPGTDTPMLKAQHPEYEMYTADSTHYKAGVACADCHMPYVREGAIKYSSHNIHSPLLNPQAACGQCHTDVNYVVGRVETIQDQVYTAKLALEDALVDAIFALKAASANPNADPKLLEEARQLHRRAQFMWDFVSAENSMGFHNPEYALAILSEATNLARQMQMKAAQAVNDPPLLQIGMYYSLDPVPTPASPPGK
ncbi:MAG: ammonia-forming cytochrome c nitrite reductase subunit c552 [Anaerolineales bacterium]|nr:ammonia-forming cytochrome c nitrite reductase subunit c552 [Anaerolineales bacterium]